jgi:hypothetical protein
MAGTDVIVHDKATGTFGFRIELGRDRVGARVQARAGGFSTEKSALAEYRRLARVRDLRRRRVRLTDPITLSARTG